MMDGSYRPPQDKTADLSLEDFFAGSVQAIGYVASPGGRVKRRFQALFQSECLDGELRINERLTYADGEEQQKQWLLKSNPDQGMVGTCDGLPGRVTITQSSQGEWFWRYAMEVQAGPLNILLNVRDHMLRVRSDCMLSVLHVRKWGLPVATVHSVYHKL